MRYSIESYEIDQTLPLQEDEETLTVPAVIAREIVQSYDGVKMYKPADELRKTTLTALNAWVTHEHPESIGLRRVEDIRGTCRDPVFIDDGAKIRTDLVFFKNMCSSQYLEDIKNRKINSVSIGFFFDLDPTPGEWNGQHYDAVQRNIFIDHVATGEVGRCPYPLCGIGVDTPHIHLFAVDPWEVTEKYIRSGHRRPQDFVRGSLRTIWISKEQGIKAIIGKPKKNPDHTEVQSYLFLREKGWTLEKARAWFREHRDDILKPAKTKSGTDSKCSQGGSEMDPDELQGAYDQLKTEHEQLKAEYHNLEDSVKALIEERDDLKTKYEEAQTRLEEIDKVEKDAKVKEILEASEGVWTEEDLSKMEMDQLDLILKSLGGTKGTRKGIRPGEGAGDKPSVLTVGCQFHKPLGEVSE